MADRETPIARASSAADPKCSIACDLVMPLCLARSTPQRNHTRRERRYRGVMPATLSERLVDAMEMAGISNAELARLVGVTRSAVTHWVNGTSPNIRPEHLFRVADALNVEARWLAIGDGPRSRQRLSAQQSKLLDAYHHLPPDAREAVAVLMFGIADKAGTYKP